MILPTGLGKTLTWIVAQHLESREMITIVIVPLSALLMDLATRLKRHGQPVHVASGANSEMDLQTRTGFVLTSVERATQSATVRAIHAAEHRIVSRIGPNIRGMTLIRARQSRIVFDESHLSYTARDYRQVMNGLAGLMNARPPVVLMTGTCAPKMERPMMANLGLRDVATIRSPTDRSEIMYSVYPGEPLVGRSLTKAVERWYNKHLGQRLVGSKIQVLIYVALKVTGREIAKQLGVDFFESGTAIDVKKKLYTDFRNGAIKVMVATQAFGAGIDIGTVEIVIHAGSPRTMVDFAQEAGRAGRSGRPALSVVFRSHDEGMGTADENCGAQEMADWLAQDKVCRRWGLSAYLDGGNTTCAALPGGMLCDIFRAEGGTGAILEEDLYAQIESRRTESIAASSAETTAVATESFASSMGPPRNTPSWSDGEASLTQISLVSPFRYRPKPAASIIDGIANTPYTRPPSQRPSMSGSQSGSMSRPPITPLKRGLDLSADPTKGAAKRRAAVKALLPTDREEISLEGPAIGVAAKRTVRVCDTTPIALKLLPLLRTLKRKGRVCFTCIGLGTISKCPPKCCPVERKILSTEGAGDMVDLVNQLGDLLKFDLTAAGYCPRCYLPSARDSKTNEFHPMATQRDGSEGVSCLIFSAVASKALVGGARIWMEGMRKRANNQAAQDPEWLKDLMHAGRRVPEVSIESWARLLKSECGEGDYWFLRIFYGMVKQAVESDR